MPALISLGNDKQHALCRLVLLYLVYTVSNYGLIKSEQAKLVDDGNVTLSVNDNRLNAPRVTS